MDVSGARALAERLAKERRKHAEDADSGTPEQETEQVVFEDDDSSLGSSALALRLRPKKAGADGSAATEADEPVVHEGADSATEQEAATPQPPRPKSAGGPVVLDRRWDIGALASLVELRAGDFPERVVEWKAYVMELEPLVEEDGRAPAHFDGLIAEIFGDLVDDV